MPPRIPTPEDFTQVQKLLPLTLAFPNPPESTTAILLLFHGLGDSEAPFASFARAMSLPGVLSISLRGPSPLPPSMLPDDDGSANSAAGAPGHFHWGDDITFDPSTDALATDPGFSKSSTLVVDHLIRDTLIARCGWELSDIILFGFGQGGSLALGIASQLRLGPKVVDVTDLSPSSSTTAPTASASKPKRNDSHFDENTLKGVLSIGGPLPPSMVPTVSARGKCKTKACLVQLNDDAFDAVKEEFLDVRLVKWKRKDVAMPRDREEMFPLMKFFAECLKSGW
ncbi:phospholipase/Carboxylesterase superfamily protein [Colletotrichum godetiae]|uniref:Phospholipase/Carboxylesterase superfamily protein n=1 Tax=Colletotrichum godetiae TaxID=1209918 RepID=A0AAJ0AQT5_9PEZI|nr:phospholipase/Carboxylesterase superfamily protein [Colletotrichum godetiae]KAK1687992.1 phospholipase/Carboxylesterase superfamily protein [Colletotrichum godetiae]